MCVCNNGYILIENSCEPCQPNQIVEKDECNENNVCKDCPIGMHPTIDRQKCIDDDDDDMCTIDGYALNSDQTDCVKGWYYHTFE